MGDFETIRVDTTDPQIAVLTFDRPAVRNALNAQMVAEIHAALDMLEAQEALRALVLTGAGDRAFVSGADIGELRGRRSPDALLRINARLMRHIECFPHPTIAAIRGYALGGGCELAMACDLRVAGRGARFGQPETGLGILPGAGATYRLPRLVGYGVACELVLTGRIIDADEALRIGLVNRVVDDEAVVDEAIAMARRIATRSQLATRFAKMALQASLEASTAVTMALESTAQAVLFDHPDKVERMTAFLERRKKRTS